jgi:hypothetical protein
MSLQRCSGTTGFPLRISKNLFTTWDGGFDPSDPAITRQLVVPTDFSVSWAPGSTVNISVDSANAQFKIQGLDNIAYGTELIYGSARYSCQPILSVVKAQHKNLVPISVSATQEIIMTFLIKNKESNPSSPDVILLCRPVILVEDPDIGTPFWKAVNSAALNTNTVRVDNYNGAENFTYADRQTLMPMITYETCIPTRLIGGSSASNPMEGSTKIRVHVVTQALSIPSDTSGTGNCTRVSRFVMPITTPPTGLKDLFNRNDYTNIQFADGSAATNYPQIPSTLSDSLSLYLPSSPEISSWESPTGAGSVLQTLQYLVPESFLGKSLSEISEISTIPKSRSTNKAYKCYSIDPTTDIVGDNILIDPTTGESLQTTTNKVNLMRSGGDPALAAALAGQAVQKTGVLPGDIEEAVLIGFSTLMAVGLLGQLMYSIRFFMNDNSSEGLNQLVWFAIYLLIVVGLSLIFAVAAKKIGNTKAK